jgi:hypothetical protein
VFTTIVTHTKGFKLVILICFLKYRRCGEKNKILSLQKAMRDILTSKHLAIVSGTVAPVWLRDSIPGISIQKCDWRERNYKQRNCGDIVTHVK